MSSWVDSLNLIKKVSFENVRVNYQKLLWKQMTRRTLYSIQHSVGDTSYLIFLIFSPLKVTVFRPFNEKESYRVE